MKTYIIRGGSLISLVNGYHQDISDILVENGLIKAIAPHIEADCEVIDATGCLVTPGLIDIHTHCYTKAFLGLPPDVVGIQRGVTTIIDAGSSGCDTFEDFLARDIQTSKTKVFALLNVSREGLLYGHELDQKDKLDEAKLIHILHSYPDYIVGLKARASASVVGNMGLSPIVKAAQLASVLHKGLTVHVGNYPPALSDVLNLLHKGDMVTHAFHGKKGGLLRDAQTIIPEAIAARKRGVLFDVGHGVASFSFRVYEQAKALGFDTDMISTDLHVENYEGPVYHLPAVITKMINCKETLEDAIHKCSAACARHYGLSKLGELQVGYIADFTLMKLVPCDEIVNDAIGDTIRLSRKLVLQKTIYSRGDESEVFEHVS